MPLTADTQITKAIGKVSACGVAASTKIYEGSMVGLNGSGYARPLVAGDIFLGHATCQADNSAGVDGYINVEFNSGVYSLKITLTGVAVTDVGRSVYASDDATFTFTPAGNTFVGKVTRYDSADTAIVEFMTEDQQGPFIVEFDCETGQSSGSTILIPADSNKNGLLVIGVYGIVTEQFAGTTQDQGIVTVEDSDATAIATLTASNAGADAVNDVIIGTSLPAATTGDAAKVVPAGKAVRASVTQATSGGVPAGKMRVYVDTRSLI